MSATRLSPDATRVETPVDRFCAGHVLPPTGLRWPVMAGLPTDRSRVRVSVRVQLHDRAIRAADTDGGGTLVSADGHRGQRIYPITGRLDENGRSGPGPQRSSTTGRNSYHMLPGKQRVLAQCANPANEAAGPFLMVSDTNRGATPRGFWNPLKNALNRSPAVDTTGRIRLSVNSGFVPSRS